MMKCWWNSTSTDLHLDNALHNTHKDIRLCSSASGTSILSLVYTSVILGLIHSDDAEEEESRHRWRGRLVPLDERNSCWELPFWLSTPTCPPPHIYFIQLFNPYPWVLLGGVIMHSNDGDTLPIPRSSPTNLDLPLCALFAYATTQYSSIVFIGMPSGQKASCLSCP